MGSTADREDLTEKPGRSSRATKETAMRNLWGLIVIAGLVGTAVCTADLAAQEPSGPAGFVLWTSADVDAIGDRLEREIGDRAMVYETIRNEDGHSVYYVLRGQTGRAEYHETEADLYVVHRGRATFVIGGELVGAESLPRKQQRGSGIRGGTRHELGPGDILHVPMATAHHIIIPAGGQFLYTLVKFDEEPLQ